MWLKKKIWSYWQRHLKKKKAREFFGKTLGPNVLKILFQNYEWAAPPTLLEKLQKINRALKPKLIVEFGSGLSTVVLAESKIPEATLVTLDESMEFLKKTYAWVSNPKNVVFVHAPAEGPINYKFFTSLVGFRNTLDLVVIDGPSGERFHPEANLLYEKLIGENTICIIDDTDRVATNQAAQTLADQKGLIKVDYTDPVYTNQRYSILFPKNLPYQDLFPS